MTDGTGESIPLRDHFEMRWDAHSDEHARMREQLVRDATEVDRRLAGMNEVRDQLREQAAQFIGRVEFDGIDARLRDIRDGLTGRVSREEHDALLSRVAALERGNSQDRGVSQGRASLWAIWATVAAMVIAIAAVAATLATRR